MIFNSFSVSPGTAGGRNGLGRMTVKCELGTLSQSSVCIVHVLVCPPPPPPPAPFPAKPSLEALMKLAQM